MLNSLANLPQGWFLCKRFLHFSYTHIGKEKCEPGAASREKGEKWEEWVETELGGQMDRFFWAVGTDLP
jgi:hypothetical protein